MKREPRFRRCDNDPQAITRPDIACAPIPLPEESGPASSIEPMRELLPYTAPRPHSDDATVKYALVQGASTVTPRHDGERPSDVPAEHRSGTRSTPTSTLPPPAPALPPTRPPASGVQAKAPAPPKNAALATPLPGRAERIITPSISFAPPPQPLQELLPPVAAQSVARREGPSTWRVVLLLAVTSIAAAAVGASLGDGSLQRLWARWFGAAPNPALVPSHASEPAAAPSARATATPLRVTPPAERPAPAVAPSAPAAVRFQDLPAEPTTADDAPAVPAVRKHPRVPRRR